MYRSMHFLSIYLCVYSIFFNTNLFAGTISLATTAKASANNQWLELDITVKNIGNETAQNSTLNIHNEGKLKPLAPATSLSAGSETHQQIRLQPTPYPKEGRYYLPLTIRYQDSNGYPFEVVQMIEVMHGKPATSELALQTQVLNLPHEKTLELRIENKSEKEKEVQFSCWLPMGITCTSMQPVKIAGKAKVNATFQLSHAEIWPSNYQGYIVADVLNGEVHSSEILSVAIEVQPNSNWLQWFFQPTVLAFVLFLCVLISFVVSYRQGRQHA